MLGHRTAQGWVIDATGVVTGNVRSDTYYDLQVIVERPRRHRLVNGAHVLSKQLAPRYIDGQPYGFNMGLVGVGSNNSRGTFDNFTVQALPPQSTFENTEDFADGVADLFTGDAAGTWTVARRPLHRHAVGERGRDERDDPAGPRAGDTEVDVDAMVRLSSGGSGGLVFDYYGDRRLQVRRRSTSRPARSSSATGSGTSGSIDATLHDDARRRASTTGSRSR